MSLHPARDDDTFMRSHGLVVACREDKRLSIAAILSVAAAIELFLMVSEILTMKFGAVIPGWWSDPEETVLGTSQLP
jgi:hypothetical protein